MSAKTNESANNNDEGAESSKASDSRKAKRGKICLKRLAKRRARGIRNEVQFNHSGPSRKPVGAVASEMQSYIGLLARKHVKVNYKTWIDVPVEVKDKIWASVTMAYIVDEKWKRECLKSAGIKWRTWKSRLYTTHIVPNKDDPEKLHEPPPESGIEAVDWGQFVSSRLSDESKMLSEKQKERRKNNIYPHRLSRNGYVRLAEVTEDELCGDCEIDTAMLWKRARETNDGVIKNKKLKMTMEKIDDYICQKKAGVFKSKGNADLLTSALETSEHSRCVRAVGANLNPQTNLKCPRESKGKSQQIAGDQLQELVDLRRKIAEQDARIGEQESKGKSQQIAGDQLQELVDLRRKIAEQDARIGEQDARIGEQLEELVDARRKIAEQDARIAEQDAKLEVHDTQLHLQEKVVYELLDRIGKLEEALSAKDKVEEERGKAKEDDEDDVHAVDDEDVLQVVHDMHMPAQVNEILIILDINGVLASIVQKNRYDQQCKTRCLHFNNHQFAFLRPFYREFLEFLFQNFKVGLWTSRMRRNLEIFCDKFLPEFKSKFYFLMSQGDCRNVGQIPTENGRTKPKFVKDIKVVWSNNPMFNISNTLLVDDSPYKGSCNPEGSTIFPLGYDYRDEADCALGPGGIIREYLENLLNAKHVAEFVKKNPFGESSNGIERERDCS